MAPKEPTEYPETERRLMDDEATSEIARAEEWADYTFAEDDPLEVLECGPLERAKMMC